MAKKMISRQITFLSIIISAWLWNISTAQAAVISVENNSTVTADISASDATRISVVGDRITLIRGTAGAYTVSNDTTQGAVFIKPGNLVNHAMCKTIKQKPDHKNSNKKRRNKKECFHQTHKYLEKSFYLFVSTEQNHNYVLQLTPKLHQGADLLVLKPLEMEKAAALAWEKSDTYSHTLIQLVVGIMHDQTPKGYTVTPLAQDFTWGSQIALHLSQRLTGAQFIAECYRVTNHSRQPAVLTEKAFYQSGDRAIFLKKARLAPNESTVLIKVRSAHA